MEPEGLFASAADADGVDQFAADHSTEQLAGAKRNALRDKTKCRRVRRQSDADPVQVWVGKLSCRNSASATPCFPALRLACWRGAQGQGCHPNGGNGLSFVGAAAVITGSGCHVRRGRSEGTQAKRRSRSDSAAP